MSTHPYNTCRILLRNMRQDRVLKVSPLMHDYWSTEFRKHWPYRNINVEMGREQWAKRCARYRREGEIV